MLMLHPDGTLTRCKGFQPLRASKQSRLSLALEAMSKDVFKFDPAKHTLLLKQGSGAFTFAKE